MTGLDDARDAAARALALWDEAQEGPPDDPMTLEEVARAALAGASCAAALETLLDFLGGEAQGNKKPRRRRRREPLMKGTIS